MKKRRSSKKEPELPENSPFTSVVSAGRGMVNALMATIPDDPDARNVVIAKVEGMETIILLCLRAGAGRTVTADGQQLVKVVRSRRSDQLSDGAPTVGGLAALEARVARLESGREHPSVRISPENGVRSGFKEPFDMISGTHLDAKLGRCERALLVVLAQRRGRTTTSAQLAVLSGYSFKSSGFTNAMSKLRTLGLAEGRSWDIQITPKGEKEAPTEVPPTSRRLMESWVQALGKAEGALLVAICDAYPHGLYQDQLSQKTGYSRTSSGFTNAISKLRTLKLAEKGWPLKAAAVLFEGERR